MKRVGTRIPSPARRVFWALTIGFALLIGGLEVPGSTVAAEGASQTQNGPNAAAGKMQALKDLLADPDVAAMLARRESEGTENAAQTAPPKTMAVTLSDRLEGLRSHLLALAASVPELGSQAVKVRGMVGDTLEERGGWPVALFFLAFVALGFGAEWLFRLAMRPAQAWLLKLTLETVNERVRAVFARLVYGLGIVVSFALGSVGAFLLFDWPAVLKETQLGYLIAFLSVRLIAVAGRILLAPGGARFRVVPITTEGALFLFKRWIMLAILIGFGWQTVSIFGRFGLSPLSSELCGDAIGLVALAIGLETLWRAPRMRLVEAGENKAQAFTHRHHSGLRIAFSCVLVVLWLLWVAQASQWFWLVAFAAALPATIVVARDSVNHVLRPAGSSISLGDAKTLDVIVFERGVRGLIIVGAAVLLGQILGVDFTSLTMQDTPVTRLIRGAVSIVVIVLAADFIWRVIKALVDRRLAINMLRGEAAGDAGHAARLQTLLPILSNLLLVTIVVLAAMMALAATGVQIGPLIASAGVVGVAIGFGAQTLVKDIISGIFYLLDDAFRIGEYIQSGTFKGTVESFSLRSVKLRHQRGALYTVPFGILGAVQNQSRDWVVDKIVMNVPYGTDLDKVRKLIKRIGETLLEDPDWGSEILNPLKMQGVVQFGDFAIQIQTKMMTKPGDVQFMARRRALLMINRSFAENGIGFAMPMVHVAGEAGGAAAAAQKALELLRPVKAE